MNGEEGNTEYLSLKSLLQQWKLTHLLQYFMSQNICIDVLKMIKMDHIPELLQNFTCGDRIRFEYELEKWRYSIGYPMQHAREMHIMPISMPSTISHGIASNNLKQNPTSKDCETQTIAKDVRQNNNAHDSFFNFKSQKPTVESSTSPTQPNQPQLKEISMRTPCKQIYSPRLRSSPSPPPSIIRDPHARGRPSADFLAQQMSMKLDAREILQNCSPRGPELMRLYETNKRFRPVERVELINLFAHYFYEHSIHLPVKLSYELERQILKLFPGERLKDYRTEKRGKIYIRLSNIKNNRRRAREAKMAFLRSAEKPEQKESDDETFKNGKCDDLNAEDTEIMDEENSDSIDQRLKIFFSDVKQETSEDIEFQD